MRIVGLMSRRGPGPSTALQQRVEPRSNNHPRAMINDLADTFDAARVTNVRPGLLRELPASFHGCIYRRRLQRVAAETLVDLLRGYCARVDDGHGQIAIMRPDRRTGTPGCLTKCSDSQWRRSRYYLP